MATDTTDQGPGAPPQGPPPWIDPTLQQRVTWRDGDIVVSVPPKSGTTWTMNIVHQLRTGGDPSFADVYAEVPWLELVPKPDSDRDAIVASFDAMTNDRRRAFKSHGAPPELPYVAPGAGPDVRYLVVVRNPDEAVASFRPFIASHSDEFFALWGVDPSGIVGPDFATYFAGMGSHALVPRIFGFLAEWWPMRNEPNVMFVHYADLVREPEPSIRRIAEFLGFAVADDRWPNIFEYTSFGWMKANEDKFELRSVADVPMLDPGAMLRKGRLGTSHEDGITPEISAAIAAIGGQILTDPAAFDWAYNGGALPT
jgi:aryl sulfotransferase